MRRAGACVRDLVGTAPSSHAASSSSAHKYTFTQAVALNTMTMFGTGPFISIPLCLAATVPAGPHALIGYAIAVVGCFADSFIWGELGSRYPLSGGTYSWENFHQEVGQSAKL